MYHVCTLLWYSLLPRFPSYTMSTWSLLKRLVPWSSVAIMVPGTIWPPLAMFSLGSDEMGLLFPGETVEIRDTAEPAAWHRTAPKTKISFAQEPVEAALGNTY